MSDFDALCSEAFIGIQSALGDSVQIRMDGVVTEVPVVIERNVEQVDAMGVLQGVRTRIEYRLADGQAIRGRGNEVCIDGVWRAVDRVESKDAVTIRVLLV